MKTEKIKDIAYYEGLPYTVVVRKDEDGDFVARIQELAGCISHGGSEISAMDNLRSMRRLWLEDALSAGDIIPEPEHETELPSGKWVQRVPKRLHRELADLAKRDNVSLNQLVTSMLSRAVTEKSCTRVFEDAVAKVFSTHQMNAYIPLPPSVTPLRARTATAGTRTNAKRAKGRVKA